MHSFGFPIDLTKSNSIFPLTMSMPNGTCMSKLMGENKRNKHHPTEGVWDWGCGFVGTAKTTQVVDVSRLQNFSDSQEAVQVILFWTISGT